MYFKGWAIKSAINKKQKEPICTNPSIEAYIYNLYNKIQIAFINLN